MFRYNLRCPFMEVAAMLLLVIIFCLGCSQGKKEAEVSSAEETDLLSLVSVQIPDWQEKKTTFITKAEDIHKYVKDEAELYLAYDFRRLAAKEYKREKSHIIQVEVYEFDSSENAYGIYSFDTVGDKPDIGQGGVYRHGLLQFWKDNFLVRVVAEAEYQALEADILAFGRQVDSKILTEGSKPDLLSLVPEENLVPDSLHFFHKNICLNNICYIPESTLLNLSEQTDAVAAQYAFEGKRPPWQLILIRYPDESAAKTAFEAFSASYFQEEPISAEQRINVVKIGDDEYNSISLNRNFVIIVLEARRSELCTKLVAAVSAEIELHREN